MPINPEKKDEQAWWQPALQMFARLSGWIVAPLLLGLALGKWLDRKFDTAPWLFLASTMLAFLISMFALVKNAMEEYRKIEKDQNSQKNNSNPRIDSNASNNDLGNKSKK
jgi:F0F1-type ATP synthase assembly protein I